MPASPTRARPPVSPAGAPTNWARYLDLLVRRGVPERARQWYARRGRGVDTGSGFPRQLRATSCSGREAPASRPLRRSSSFRDHRRPDASLKSLSFRARVAKRSFATRKPNPTFVTGASGYGAR
jgi:hypothetical protein